MRLADALWAAPRAGPTGRPAGQGIAVGGLAGDPLRAGPTGRRPTVSPELRARAHAVRGAAGDGGRAQGGGTGPDRARPDASGAAAEVQEGEGTRRTLVGALDRSGLFPARCMSQVHCPVNHSCGAGVFLLGMSVGLGSDGDYGQCYRMPGGAQLVDPGRVGGEP